MSNPDPQDFLTLFAEVTETDLDTVTLDTPLAEVNGWDSLSMVMFIGTVDDKYDAQIDGAALSQARTVRDLYDLII